MVTTRGTPLEGDRGAFNTVDHDEVHALDIKNAALLRHTPVPGAAWQIIVSDAINWITGTTAITGGGTIVLDGFTLTVPATGIATLGTGAQWNVALWSDANTVKALGALGAAGQFLRSAGAGADPAWAALPGFSGATHLLFSQVADATVADTVVETTILGAGRGTKTLDADIFDVGSVVVIVCHGHVSDTGTPTLDLSVTLGGTEVCSTGAVTLAPTITEEGFTLRIEIVCRTTGGAGTVVAGGTFEYSAGNQHKLVKTATTTVDTTAALAVDVTADWGAADAANTITCQIATIQFIEADDLAVAAPGGLTAVEV